MDPIRKIDDPRITAYAFGELEGDERAAVERFLEANPDARAEVDALRALGDTLRDELADESAPSLSAAQHDAIRAAASAPAPGDGDGATAPVLRVRPLLRYVAAAAALLLVTTLVFRPGLYFDAPAVGVSTPDDEPVAMYERRDGPAAGLKPGRREGDNVALGGGLPMREQLKQADELRRDSSASSTIGVGAGDADAVARSEADRLQQLGYSGPSEAELSALAALGYVGAASEEQNAGGPLVWDSSKSRVSGGRSVLPFDDAYDAAAKAGAESEEPTRYLQTGPLPRTSTAGAVLLSDQLGVARSAPAASPPAAGEANSEAGFFFDDTGDQVLHAESEDFFDEPAADDEPKGLNLHTLSNFGEAAYFEGRDAGAADRDDESLRFKLDAARREAANESYATLHDNPFVTVVPSDPRTRLSTFGVDVDRASYANVRRFLQRNQLPPADAVRLEELVNAFEYADAAPASDSEVPFAVHVSSAAAPWAPEHRLVRVALKGRVIEQAERPAAQLTFLVDVSGSMNAADKLPLLKQSLRLLVEQLDARDQVALVTYASGSRVVLPSTPASEKATILAALDSLTAGGSTHGSAGLQLAYETAEAAALGDDGEQGTRRVLLCTDGDFNVGVTSQQGLHDLIAQKAEGGTFLTVLGFGTGNYKDTTAETLADRGNGQYAYIDGLDEAHHVLVRQLTGTLVTIAQDVKLQLEFNPAHAGAWRQLGYENRQMAAQDFRNDRKDAGEIGAGHSVVAYYEVVPTGVPLLTGTAELKYDAPVQAPTPGADDASPELLTVNLRWKQPGSTPDDPADEFSHAFVDAGAEFAEASDDFRFGAAVLAWGMALRGSPHRGDLPLWLTADLAQRARGPDPDGDRAECVKLMRRALGLLPAEASREGWDAQRTFELHGVIGYGGADPADASDDAESRLRELGYLSDEDDQR